MRSFALHQGRDHIMPGPRQITDRNPSRENIYDNIRVRLIIKTCMVIILPEII